MTELKKNLIVERKKVNKEYFSEIEKNISEDKIFVDEKMSNYTSFKTGGLCDLMIKVSSEEDIKKLLKLIKEYNQKSYIFGNCTNVIIRDKGIRATIIKIHKNYDSITVKDEFIKVKAGTLMSKLAKVAYDNELTGLEFVSGIPGTVGGGVFMNAGAYGSELKDFLVYSRYMDQNGIVHKINNKEHKFSYRKSVFGDTNNIILDSCFKLKKGNKYLIKEKTNNLNGRRKEKQPLSFPSAGSIFKRPKGYYTGELIENCDLKGYNINGAEVSDLHAGFIINKGNTTSKDIINLISHIQKTVYNKYRVKLETEVKIIGEK